MGHDRNTHPQPLPRLGVRVGEIERSTKGSLRSEPRDRGPGFGFLARPGPCDSQHGIAVLAVGQALDRRRRLGVTPLENKNARDIGGYLFAS